MGGQTAPQRLNYPNNQYKDKMATEPKPNQTSRQASMDNDEIDLAQLFSTLWFHKYHIGTAIVACALLGGIYAFGSTPVYKADAMLEFSGRKNQILGDLTDVLGGSQQSPTDAEVELIRSRLVIGQSIEDLALDTRITPKYFPVLGKWWQRSDVPPVLSLGIFSVPDAWLGKPFELTAHSKVDYTLTTPDGEQLSGKVGEKLSIDADSELLVTKLIAPQGQDFELVKYSFLNTVDNVRANLSAAPKGKNSAIIGLSYTGVDAVKNQQILNQIIHNYVLQNRDKEVQVAASGLAFIGQELPRLKEELQQSENKLNNYRAKSGSLDMPTEAKGTLDSLTKIEMQITDLRAEEAGLAERYTKEHPAYRALLDKINVLNQAKTKLNQQIAGMPQTQQEIIRLTRDVEINQAIYVQLLNKQQELSILKASSQGNVRVVDTAMTAEKPIKPKKGMIILLASLLGGMAAAGWVLAKSMLNRGITSAEEIEALGMGVFASVPFSETQRKRDILLAKLKRQSPTHARANTLLALKDPADVAVEAIRALRTSLYFSLMDAKTHVVMISGATPGVGKSFVSANLAAVMAQADKKVLLIDGDMRKGYMHQLLEMEMGQGLAEILASKDGDFEPYIKATHLGNMYFLSGGSTPKNPSELLLNGRINAFLKWASQQFDYVILDTPPVLAVTDAAVMGQHADVSLLVARFGQTGTRELEACMTRFDNSNVTIKGVILNGIKRTAVNYYEYESYTKYANK